MSSAFDAYAAAFVSPVREAWMGDERLVRLRVESRDIAELTAILMEVRQDEPELSQIANGASERTSRLVREVEFQNATLAQHGVEVGVGMQVVIDGKAWAIRRLVGDSTVATRVECSRKVKHAGGHTTGGAAR